MNLRLSLARMYIPFWIRKKKLKELFILTARALQSREPPLKGLSAKQMLERYALFTKEKTDEILARGTDTENVRNLLRQNAFRIGRDLRRTLRITSPGEFMAAAQILYRLIGIDFRGSHNGRITIEKCYFSRVYSEQVCQIISSLDEGLLAGLSEDGGNLEFSNRITAGADCCRAVFRFRGRKV
jgi:hypothetical protein